MRSGLTFVTRGNVGRGTCRSGDSGVPTKIFSGSCDRVNEIGGRDALPRVAARPTYSLQMPMGKTAYLGKPRALEFLSALKGTRRGFSKYALGIFNSLLRPFGGME